MRLICLNAWGGQVWEPLRHWLPECGADVLVCQEVTRAPQPSPDWLVYRDPQRELMQRANLFGDISRLLPGYQAQFVPAARGSLETLAGRALASEHGNGIWLHPRLAIVAQYQTFVHGSYRSDGWGEPPRARPIHVVRIADPEGPAFLLAHLHGLHDPAGKGDTPARAAQTDAILAAIDQLRSPQEAVILAGDLNLLPESAAFERFAAAGLHDLVTSRGFTDTRSTLYPKTQRFADYMLVNDQVQVEDFDVPATPEVSDHRPLILDFSVQP